MGSRRSNVELAHTLNRALNEGGTDAILPFYAEDVEWYMPDGWLEQDVYRGREGIRELADAWFGQFDEYHWDEIEVTEIDSDRILGLYQMRGRIKGTGVPIEQPVALIVTVGDDELIASVDSFFNWDEGREAAGLEP